MVLIQVLGHVKSGGDLLKLVLTERNDGGWHQQMMGYPDQMLDNQFGLPPSYKINLSLTSEILIYAYALKLDKLIDVIV